MGKTAKKLPDPKSRDLFDLPAGRAPRAKAAGRPPARASGEAGYTARDIEVLEGL